jgi:uncharacterized protein (DUF2336 family)
MLHSLASRSHVLDRNDVPLGGQEMITTTHQSLIDELEAVIGQRSIGSRVDILQRVTDLFVTGSNRFNGEQRALFDDVMCRLVDEIEHTARVAFGERLATVSNAPPKVSCALALDDSIEVAGSLLVHSDQLDDETLATVARTKSQEHLLAISQRKLVSKDITDILVERGNQQVVINTVANVGAQFSEYGYSKLVVRSENNDKLALTVLSRSEIPREWLLTVFTIASEAVQLEFEIANRRKAALLRSMVKQASDQIQQQARECSPNYAAMLAYIQSLRKAGLLTEDQLQKFADAKEFDKTAIALSLLSNLPIGAIERAMVHDHSDQMLVVAKFIDLSWETTKAILLIAPKSISTRKLKGYHADFEKLKPETARTAIQFYRLQERAVTAAPN